MTGHAWPTPPRPTPEELEWEAAWLTVPDNRRAVVTKRASIPSAYFRGGMSRRRWQAINRAPRRAILDTTAPMPEAPRPTPTPPAPSPLDVFARR